MALDAQNADSGDEGKLGLMFRGKSDADVDWDQFRP